MEELGVGQGGSPGKPMSTGSSTALRVSKQEASLSSTPRKSPSEHLSSIITCEALRVYVHPGAPGEIGKQLYPKALQWGSSDLGRAGATKIALSSLWLGLAGQAELGAPEPLWGGQLLGNGWESEGQLLRSEAEAMAT